MPSIDITSLLFAFGKSFLFVLAAVLPIVNPAATAPIFLGLTEGASAATRAVLARRIARNMVLLMVGAKAAADERTAGEVSPVFRSSESRGIQALRSYLGRIGVPLDGVLIEDGPGLSRRDLTSPAALASLLIRVGDNPGAKAFRLGLPEAGVDGSLTGRMRNSAAQGRIHAKTGSMAFTYALAGYALTAADERLAFAIMLNNYRRPVDAGRPTAELDAIAIMLAELSERSQP